MDAGMDGGRSELTHAARGGPTSSPHDLRPGHQKPDRQVPAVCHSPATTRHRGVEPPPNPRRASRMTRRASNPWHSGDGPARRRIPYSGSPGLRVSRTRTSSTVRAGRRFPEQPCRRSRDGRSRCKESEGRNAPWVDRSGRWFGFYLPGAWVPPVGVPPCRR